MNFDFVLAFLFLVLCFRVIQEGMRADRAERGREEYKDIAERSLKAGSEGNEHATEALKELQQWQRRNRDLQDQLHSARQVWADLMNHRRAELILGNPYSWAGGMQAGKEIHFKIKSPDILQACANSKQKKNHVEPFASIIIRKTPSDYSTGSANSRKSSLSGWERQRMMS